MLPMTTRCLTAYRAESCCPKTAEGRPVIIVPDQIVLPGNGAAVTPRSPGVACPGATWRPALARPPRPGATRAIRPGYHQVSHHRVPGPGSQVVLSYPLREAPETARDVSRSSPFLSVPGGKVRGSQSGQPSHTSAS